MLTKTQLWAVELSIQGYATYKDFSAGYWLKAKEMVRNDPKLQEYIKRLTK
jgi:hypothetical protein